VADPAAAPAPPREPPLLEVADLRAGYDGVEVLRGLSFRLAPGSLTAVVGPNGAGKSTLLRALFGRVRVTAGGVRFRGEPITGLPPGAVRRRGISYVAQGRCNFPRMTVRENLEMGAFIRGADPGVTADLAAVLDRFPVLRERASARAGDLSGGQQQLLEMAMGVLSRPALLLLDEPSMGLAPATLAALFDAIRGLHRAGTAVLLVEQNARKALETADHGLVLELGALRYDAPAAALLADPRVRALYLGG
jgi:branched-chain amino acid transport system ATP-binding protein